MGDDGTVTGRGVARSGGYSLYEELAGWWPVISPPAEYADDASIIADIFALAAQPVRTVLDLGCGGGHVALYLKDGRSMTLVDLSAQMLDVSQRLNPDCAHVQGDMRTIRLGCQFDAVLVHDAVDYVTSQDDLSRVIHTAFEHCRPGGLAIFAPDHTAETFRAGAGGGGGHDGTGRHASFRSSGLPGSPPRFGQVFTQGTGPDPPRSSSSAAGMRVRRDTPSAATAALGAGRRHPGIAVGPADAARSIQRVRRQATPAAAARA
jgi:SAM-dependent methyltransferase